MKKRTPYCSIHTQKKIGSSSISRNLALTSCIWQLTQSFLVPKALDKLRPPIQPKQTHTHRHITHTMHTFKAAAELESEMVSEWAGSRTTKNSPSPFRTIPTTVRECGVCCKKTGGRHRAFPASHTEAQCCARSAATAPLSPEPPAVGVSKMELLELVPP